MAKRLNQQPKPRVTMNSPFGYEERTRDHCYVDSQADLEYGMVPGFRYGIEQTGHRTKLSAVGKRVKRG